MWPRCGEVLGGKYVVIDEIGSGGMATVFRAGQPALARIVAIKLLHPCYAAIPELARRFHGEAIAASRLVHPNLVSMIDFGHTDDGTPFLVMEYVGGHTIVQLLRRDGTLSLHRVARLMSQILETLGAVHAVDIIHADIKSDNIVVEENAAGDRVRIVDFGLARVSLDDRAPGADGAISGTPEYMAPEIIRGEPITASVDLYGAGVILYELLVGATPFAGGSPDDVMARHVADVVVPPSLRRPDRAISPALDRVVVRALAKRPQDRFADAAAFASALADAIASQPADGRICETCGERAPISATFCPYCGVPWSPPSRSPTSPTRDRRSPHRIARGSASPTANAAREARLRDAIGHAIRRGEVDEIAGGYLGLARSLVAAERLDDAICELEEALDLLGGTRGACALGPGACRLLAELAILYDARGDRVHARRARAAIDHHRTLPSLPSS